MTDTKFKVGDRVRVVENRKAYSAREYRDVSIKGFTGTVTEMDPSYVVGIRNLYMVALDNDPTGEPGDWSFFEEEIEFDVPVAVPLDADAKALDKLALLWRVISGDNVLSAQGVEVVREILTETGRDAG